MDRPDDQTASGLDRFTSIVRGEAEGSPMTQPFGFAGRLVAEGEVVFAATPTAAHKNSGGTIHGGYAATLLDTAMGWAAQTTLAAGQNVVTMDLHVAYHRAMTEHTGPIEATGRVLSRGRRAVFAEGRIVDAEGRLLASGSATLMIVTR